MDAFARLGLPRKAALSAEEIRRAFQQAGAALHPDAATDEADRLQRTAAFTALNDAHSTLLSLPRRLRHLLELEYSDLAVQKTGAVLDDRMMALFSLTGSAVQRATAVQAKKQSAGSALAKAMLASGEMQAQEALEAATQEIEAARGTLEAELASLDNARAAGIPTGQALQSCAARAGFLEKWHAQLRAAFAGFFSA